jgi:hypothetical protein
MRAYGKVDLESFGRREWIETVFRAARPGHNLEEERFGEAMTSCRPAPIGTSFGACSRDVLEPPGGKWRQIKEKSKGKHTNDVLDVISAAVATS